MFSDLLLSIANQYAKNLPFVVYRKPKEQKVHTVFQENTQVHHVHNFNETGFVFAPFDKSSPSILMHTDRKLEALYFSKNPKKENNDITLETNAKQKEFHVKLVQQGITEIKSGSIEKVVLSRSVDVKCETAPLELFQKLLDEYNTAFCYLWHHPKVGTWLGATPEILLKIENQQLTTMSLAGTQKFMEGVTPEWGKKEIEEQQLVTDYISNAIDNTVSNLEISERESVRAGSLWHLRTKLTASLNLGDFAAIIQALHPTPAVCGLPMLAAKKFILQNEDYTREFYTGYLGELNFKKERDRSSNRRNQENKAYKSIKTKTILFVNLRCMKITPHQVKIYVGGGVTKDSNADKEWHETVAKCGTMLKILDDN